MQELIDALVNAAVDHGAAVLWAEESNQDGTENTAAALTAARAAVLRALDIEPGEYAPIVPR